METMGPSEPEVQPTSEPAESGLSVKGLWQVFLSPGDLFAKIRKNPKVLVPWLVLVGLFIAFGFAVKELMADAQWQAFLKQGRELPSGMTEEQMKAIIGWSTLGTMALYGAISPLIAGGLLMFWGNVVFGYRRASFKSVLSVALYGAVISTVGAIATVLIGRAMGNPTFTLSLGVLAAGKGIMDPTFQALSRIGVFSIWEIVAVGVGAAAIYEVPRNKGMVLAVLSIGLQYATSIVFQVVGAAMS